MRRFLPLALAALLVLTLLPGLAAVDATDERERQEASHASISARRVRGKTVRGESWEGTRFKGRRAPCESGNIAEIAARSTPPRRHLTSANLWTNECPGTVRRTK